MPVVTPSNTPESSRTASASLRLVGRGALAGLAAIQLFWISASQSGMPGGQPSSTPPRPGPCDSPNVVRRSARPKVLPAICVLALWGGGRFLWGEGKFCEQKFPLPPTPPALQKTFFSSGNAPDVPWMDKCRGDVRPPPSAAKNARPQGSIPYPGPVRNRSAKGPDAATPAAPIAAARPHPQAENPARPPPPG